MSKLHCQKCGKSFDPDNKELGIHSLICPHCGQDYKTEQAMTSTKQEVVTATPKQEQNEPSSETSPRENNQKIKSVWEAEWKTNTFNAYISTIKSVITQPIEFFKTVKPFEDYFSLFLFIYINSLITILATMIFQFTFGAIVNPAALLSLPFIICGAIFAPFIVAGVAFLIGGLFHLFFTFIGGSEKKYETTMTVYGLGTAASLFGVIPFVGGLVNLVYFIIINIFGQAEAHEISPGKAALSLILPFILIFCLVFTAIFAIIMIAGGLGVFMESLQQ